MIFGKERTYLVDFETLTDPRIAQFFALGLVEGKLLAPQPPVPTESGNDHRTRRAWETIEALKKLKTVKLKLDPKLMDRAALLAALRKAKGFLITGNAELRSAAAPAAVNLLEIYTLFKPSYMPGTMVRLRIAKRGKEKDEGIGYLEGGIKVVVADAANSVGSEMEVVIQGALDTDVGQVVFAKPRFVEVN
jgi:uncharacterized protein YacL